MAQDLIEKIRSQAQARGLDPEIAVRIAQIESSMNPSAKAKTSTAGGLFQVVDKTWKEYGGKPGQKNNPDENIRVGLDILAANTKSLRNALGRDPSPSELYAAHFLGAQGARTLLSASPDTPVEQLLSARAIKANSSMLKGKNVGELIGVFEQKMGLPAQAAAKAPAAAPMPATPAGAPRRVAAADAAPVVAAAPKAPAAADMGAGYQAALALSFLGDEEDKAEKEDGGESAAKMLAEYKPYNALNDLDFGPSILAQAPVLAGQQPKMMADGGEVAGDPNYVSVLERGDMSSPAYRAQLERDQALGLSTPELVAVPLVKGAAGAARMALDKYLAAKSAPAVRNSMQTAREEAAWNKLTPEQKVGYRESNPLSRPPEFYQMLESGEASAIGSRVGKVEMPGPEIAARTPQETREIILRRILDRAIIPNQRRTVTDLALQSSEKEIQDRRAREKLLRDMGIFPKHQIPPVYRAEGSPETGEVTEPTPEELEAASRAAFITSKSGIGRKTSTTPGQIEGAVLQGIAETPYNLLGAPVDLTALAMRPFGYQNQTPMMGSEWIKKKMTEAGVRPKPPEQPTQRAAYEMAQFGAGLVNPAGVARTVGPVVEAGVKAGAKAVGRQLDRAVMENTGPFAKAVSDVARPMYITRPAGGEFPTAPFGQDPRSNLDKFLKGIIEDVQDQPGNPMSPEKAAAATEFFDKKLRSFFRSQAGSVSDPVREAIIAGKIKFKKDSPEEELFPQALIDAARKGDVTAMRAIENAYDKSIQVKPYRVEQANETYDQTRNAETSYRQSLLAQMAANPSIIPDPMLLRLTTKNAQDLPPAQAAARVADIRAKMAANPTYFSVVLEPKIDRLLSTTTLESVTPGSLNSYPDLYPALTSMQNAPPGRGIAALGMGERPVMDVNSAYLKPLGLKDQNIVDTIDALSIKDLKQMSVPEFFSKAMEVKGRTGELDSYVKKAGDLVRADQPVPAKVAFFGTEEFIAPDKAGMSWREITDPLATRIHGEMLNNSIAGYSRPGTYGALSKGRVALDEGAVRLFGLYDKNNRLVTNVEYVTPEAGGSQANSITQFYGNGPRTGNVTPENYLPQVESLVRQLDPDKVPYRIQELFQKNGITFTKE